MLWLEIYVTHIGQGLPDEGYKFVSPRHRPPLPHPNPPKKISWYSFLLEAEPIQGHSAAGRIMSMKNSTDIIGNRTPELPACSTVPQTNVPPRAPIITHTHSKLIVAKLFTTQMMI